MILYIAPKGKARANPPPLLVKADAPSPTHQQDLNRASEAFGGPHPPPRFRDRGHVLRRVRFLLRHRDNDRSAQLRHLHHLLHSAEPRAARP
jgi:hypothetical protein